MTLMDLALETKDFEWAKQIYNLDDQSLTESKEIKCELAEIKKAKNKNCAKEYIIQELKNKELYESYLMLTNFLRGLNEDDKKRVLIYCVTNTEDVENALKIINILEQ